MLIRGSILKTCGLLIRGSILKTCGYTFVHIVNLSEKGSPDRTIERKVLNIKQIKGKDENSGRMWKSRKKMQKSRFFHLASADWAVLATPLNRTQTMRAFSVQGPSSYLHGEIIHVVNWGSYMHLPTEVCIVLQECLTFQIKFSWHCMLVSLNATWTLGNEDAQVCDSYYQLDPRDNE